MKLEWDELMMVSQFVAAHGDLWKTHVEGYGFEAPVAKAIQCRLAKIALDAEREYIPHRPTLGTAVIHCSKGDQDFDVLCEYNHLDGWRITKVPGKLCFLLLTRDMGPVKTLLEDRGWAYKIENNLPEKPL